MRNIADVSGAGDTVIAVASLVYAATKDIELAAQMANIAGGLVCEEVGTAAIDPDKLRGMQTITQRLIRFLRFYYGLSTKYPLGMYRERGGEWRNVRSETADVRGDREWVNGPVGMDASNVKRQTKT